MSLDSSKPVERTLEMYAQLLKRGLSHAPPAQSPQFLLERFNNIQTQVLAEFGDAKNEKELSRSESLVDTLLHTHSEMWKTAIEHDEISMLDSLRELLDDIFQFRQHEYALPPHDRDLMEINKSELDFNEKKQYSANNYRRQVEELRFATYGWSIHLYTEEDLPASSVKQILKGPVAEDFGSIEKLSKVFFRLRESDAIGGIWERWNMNRELSNNFGVAVTGMATNSWMLKFYCSSLIWMIDEKDNVSTASLSPEDSPILEYSERTINIDPVIDLLDSYKKEYPLEGFLNNKENLEGICDEVITYFEGVKKVFQQRERKWTRAQPIDNKTTERFAEKVNSQINSSPFRTAIRQTSGIVENPSISENRLDSFSVAGRFPRRAFIDSGIETFFNNNFARILREYESFVKSQLSFESIQVSSPNSIPDVLDEIITTNDTEVIITGDREVLNVLRNHEKSNRISNKKLNSFLEFSKIPVLNAIGPDFLATAWFSEEYKYVEKSVNNPISVTITPGENVSEWDESQTPDDFSPRDWVKVTFTYEAAIESGSQNGVILQR